MKAIPLTHNSTTSFGTKDGQKENDMNTADKLKLRQELDALATKHGQDLTRSTYLVLVLTTIQFIAEMERHGIVYEVIGATSGDDFFEFDLKRK